MDRSPEQERRGRGRLRRFAWRRMHEAEAAAEGLLGALDISQPKRVVVFLLCLGAALALVLAPEATRELDPPARRGLFILAFAALLWITDAVPAFAVGILVIALQVALLGTERGGAETTGEWETFVAVIGNPMVWLFFGGFVLAAGMSAVGLDRRLAARVLARTGDRPPAVLGGIMALAFGLSLFMSNTATTAMTLAMVAPMLAALGDRAPLARALVLGTAGAANLGGMGSLIGTPPNAVAAGALARAPEAVHVDFLRWLGIGLPIALLLLAVLWRLLLRSCPEGERLPTEALRDPASLPARAPRWERIVVGATVLLTIGLWASTQWHGIPTAAVSFVPIVMFTTTGVLGVREIRGLPYDVLFLLAGGLALARVVGDTGLSDWLVELMPLHLLGELGLPLAFGYLAVVLSTLMSNTAAANLLVPIGIAVAAGHEPRVVLPVALSASAAMALPIATPPNALAFATGLLRTRDFLLPGLVIGALTPPLAVLWVWLWF